MTSCCYNFQKIPTKFSSKKSIWLKMFCIENLKCLILPVDRKMWLQPESQMMKCNCILLDVITNLLLCKRATWFIEPSDWCYLKWLQLGYWTKPYIGRSTYTYSGLQDYKDKKKNNKERVEKYIQELFWLGRFN